ncbi:MAG: DUF3185 family protein [Candidatus Sumerlaeia bacterium]|nr:DUF3185 family protein [Candidatus Sumerlaeia bacterium]
MYRGLSVAFLVAGILLIIWGISASESFDSEISRVFTGSPSDKAMWLLVGGAILGITGLFGLFQTAK